MTKQLLYYESPVPLSAKRHGDWSLEPKTDFEFAGHSNSVPLAAAEFPAAAGEFAIVFAGSEGAESPVAILGLKPDENLFVDETNQWDATYVPAFVRRYPYVFSRSKDGGKLILCIDERYTGWNRKGHGQALFDENGERTEYLYRTLNFVEEYQRQFERTQAFCRRLGELGLLQPMAARFKLPTGEKAQLTGFSAVDRERLEALPDNKLAEMARTGELELVYLHLRSLRNIEAVLSRFSGVGRKSDAAWAVDGDSIEQSIH